MTNRGKATTFTSVVLAFVGLSCGVIDVVKEYQRQQAAQWEYMRTLHVAHDTGKYVEECLPPEWGKKER